MGVAVLPPQDCLKDPFSKDNLTSPLMKYQRNPNPSRPKRQSANRRRRSPPRSQSTSSSESSPPRAASVVPKASNKKNFQPIIGQVKILKRGEEIAKITPDLQSEELDLGTTTRIGPEPENVPTQIRVVDQNPLPASFYAGPVTFTSPQPSEVPLPAFAKKSVSFLKNNDATNNLIRILRLDIS